MSGRSTWREMPVRSSTKSTCSGGSGRLSRSHFQTAACETPNSRAIADCEPTISTAFRSDSKGSASFMTHSYNYICSTVNRQTPIPVKNFGCSNGNMIIGERLKRRMSELGLSQSELGRRVGISQQTIHKLVTGASRGSTHIARLARELETTPAFLLGEVDDPAEGAPLPAPPPAPYAMLRVELPSVGALAEMFYAVLSVSRDMDEYELAHELARRLPKGLEIAQRLPPSGLFQPDGAGAAHSETPRGVAREPRRASGR